MNTPLMQNTATTAPVPNTTMSAPAEPAAPAANDDSITSNTTIIDAGYVLDAVKAQIAETVAGLTADKTASNVGDEFNPARALMLRTYHDANGTKVAAALIEIPTLNEFLADSEGRSWVEGKISNLCDKKVSMSLLHGVKSGNLDDVDLPENIADFITTARRSTGQKRFATISWTEYGSSALDAVKEAFRTKANRTLNMTKTEFQMALSDASYALAKFPDLEQAGWFSNILDILIGKPPVTKQDKRSGKERTDDGALFKHWKATRDETQADTDFDLGELTL